MKSNTHRIQTMPLALLALTLLAGPLWAQAKPTTTQTPNQAATKKGRELFQSGKTAMLTGDYAAAVAALEKAVAADKTKTSYRLYLARSYRYANKAPKAEAQLKAILKASPDHVEAGQLLGDIYAKAEDWKNLVAVLEPLLKYRHDYTTYHLLAEAKYNLDDPTVARRYYQEAIKLNAKNAMDHYRLGNLYLAGNFFALSAASYQTALNLHMDSPVLRYKLGSAYFNLRNYFGKISVVTIKAGTVGTISGDWYLIEPKPGKKDTFRVAPRQSAVYQVAKAMADGITGADIEFLKANIYLNARRYQKAYDMFAALRKTIAKADKPLYCFYYAQAAYGIDKYDEYISLLKEAIALDKTAYGNTLVEAYVQVADRYNQAGKFDKYIEYLELAMKASPQQAALHLRLGDAYEEARNYPKAVLQWQLVLDLESDHPQRTKLLNLIEKYRRIKAATTKK
jgi:tetratricopeptide (TPR) repeat protein